MDGSDGSRGEAWRRPRVGVLVLAVVVVALLLIVVAAYHGSDSATASACKPARSLLRRTLADVTAAQHDFAVHGSVPAATIGRLERDDTDLNDFINGEQTPDRSFDARALPLADQLGRVVTDLRQGGTGTIADIDQGVAAATAATEACGT